MRKFRKEIIKPFIIISLVCIFLLSTILNINAGIGNKPDFDIELSATPTQALVGEDITINGVIKPKPFEAEVAPKEIVLVLDVSGSMSNSISGKDCDHERVRYCTRHNSSDPYHSEEILGHRWRENYCTEHQTNDRHNSNRIWELKKACYEFIETMKDVENLKIGVVTYSSSAEIKKINSENKNIALIPASQTDSLKGIISGLVANGGTNTGEGLRRSIYLLDSSTESNSNANKSIVLMSDGIPTFYTSISERDRSYYMDTTTESGGVSYNSGSGSSDTSDLKDLGYAREMGKIIKSKGYNAFTIGYGMDKTGNQRMEILHNDTSNNPENFFPTSDDAIENVFQQIATAIKDSYPVPNISLNLTLSSGITLNIGGNKVSIPDITYQKVQGSGISGKVRYEAEDIPFSFIIKCSNPGFQSIYQSANITFPWNGKEEVVNINQKVEVEILPNELPVIMANLISEKEVLTMPNQDVKITYKIDAQEFEYNDSSNSSTNDVVLVIDTSKDMENYLNYITNPLWNDLLNNNSLRNKNTQYAVIKYSNEAVAIQSTLTNNVTQLNDNVIKQQLTIDNSNEKQIGDTFKIADSILQTGRVDASKNIIFVSSGTVRYTESELDVIKNKGYNIISLSLNISSNDNNSLSRLHEDIGANPEHYFYATDNPPNSIQNIIMKDIANILIGNTYYRPYTFNPILKFELGDNFIPKEGFESINGNQVIVKVPTITYNHIGNGKYVAEQTEQVEITITTKSDRFGDLEFNPLENNTVTYNKLVGGQVSFRIQTPTIKVQQPILDLRHGLENGIVNNEMDIIEGSATIANNTYANLIATGTVYSKNTNITLEINKDIDLNNLSNIKVFKIGNQNQLISMNSKVESNGDNGEQNKYKITLLEDINETTKIAIKYSVNMPYNESRVSYTNNIWFDRNYQPFTINNTTELPDLF